MSDIEESKKKTLAEARAKIFGSKKAASKIVNFFGADIEIRQPKLGDIIAAREEVDKQAAVIATLVAYAYLPGTDQKMFTPEDGDLFMEMPFGADFLRITAAIEELTDVNFLGGKGS